MINRNVKVMLWILLSLGSILFSAQAFAGTIQGRVSLPDSRVAPAGGVDIDVFGFNSVDNGFAIEPISIAAGNNFVDYTLTVTGSSSDQWNIEFFCLSNCDDYVDSIFYAATETVYSSTEADSFAGDQNYTGVDITLELANLISGQLFLPSPDVAPAGGVGLEVFVSNVSGNISYFSSFFDTIAEGNSSINYALKIPLNFAGEFIVEYFCSSNCANYVSSARYSTAGSTVSIDLATRFTGGSDFPNTNIDVLRSVELSGSVILPAGEVAPAGGVDFIVSAQEIGGNFGFETTSVSIAVGEDMVPFAIGIPTDVLANWIVEYECTNNCDGYFERGYYSVTGTVTAQDEATEINAGASSANIDLSVVAENMLSGTIFLPDGEIAPSGGITININGNTDGFGAFASQSVVIEEGLTSVGYALSIPANPSDTWRIQFNCSVGCSGLVPTAFYASSGATTEFSEATLVSGASDVSGLDITLIDGVIVSGSVSLPNGGIAPEGGLGIQIDVSSTNFQIFGSDFLTIQAGENSATFETVTIPDASVELEVSYRCLDFFGAGTGCPGYSPFGYYSTTGTVANGPDASLLAGGQDHMNINLTLIPAVQITGDLALPDGMVAPAGGIEFGINGVKLRSDPADFSISGVASSVVIPEGESVASYTLDIPQDAGLDWMVGYRCFTNCGVLYEEGYYSDAGTVFYEDQATSFSGGVNRNGIDMALFVANVIEGSIALPSSLVAPMGGIRYDLSYTGNRISDDQLLRGDFQFDLLLPEGQGSGNYSFKIPPDADAEWNLSYSCFSDSCDGYATEGYYGSPTTVPVLSEATLVPGGVDSSNIDLVFLTAVSVSGTVTIPDGLNISGDTIYFQVNVYDRNRPIDDFYESLGSAFFGMEGPITSFDYSATVFEDPSADLFVAVTCFDFSLDGSGQCDAFVSNTFHGDPNSEFNETNAVLLLGGVDHSGVDVLLIEADVISGVVSLPSGVAPTGGVDISVSAFESDEPLNFGDAVSIIVSEGDSSVSYKLRVPADLPTNNWLVQAECTNNCDDYELFNFYAATGTTSVRNQATRLPNSGPHGNIDIALLPVSILTAFSCDVLLDDFSGQTLDLDNWRDPEFSGEITGGKVLIKQKLISSESRPTSGSSRRFNLNLLTFPASISADVELIETDLTDSGTGNVFASVRGSYYYTLDSADDYDDNLGEVFASVEIGDRGNGLEAWYQILESTDSAFETFVTHVDEILIPPGSLLLNTSYNLSLGYNASTKEFAFAVDGTSASAIGPAEGAASVSDLGLFRGFTAGAVPEENDDSDSISVAATFDNIMADAVLVDDFTASTLNAAVWEQSIRNRNIVEGKLRTGITTTSIDRSSIFTGAQPSEYANASCFQASLGIDSSSDIPENARGRNRIDGYWYNAVNDGSAGSEYDGFEGTVYAQVVLEQIEDGSVRGALYAEQVDDPNYDSTTELAFHTFSTPAVLDQEYVAAIRLDRENSRLLFRFADEVFELPISTNIYPVNPPIDYVGLTTRIQDGIGEIHATVDDVYITPLAGPVDPPAGVEEICFPIVGSAGIAVVCI